MIEFTKPWGIAQYTDARICGKCGALVFDIEVHINWHAHVRTNG